MGGAPPRPEGINIRTRLNHKRKTCIISPLMLPQETTTTRRHWKDMLDTRLYHNLKVETEWNNARTQLTIRIPTKRPGWLVPPLSWIVRPPAKRGLVLDTIGADLWEWCDGQRTVEQVIEKFSAKHNLTFHEGRVSATNYLKELVRRGALAIAV